MYVSTFGHSLGYIYSVFYKAKRFYANGNFIALLPSCSWVVVVVVVAL